MRKAGWYHVKTNRGRWECALWTGSAWQVAGLGYSCPDSSFAEIGPRIPTPDEPWQAVPIEMTPEMGEEVKGWNRFNDWKAALAAAPKPGGGDE